MMRLEEVLPSATDRYGDRVALIGESGATVTYRELEAMALGCTAQLQALGVQPGHSVVLLTPNSIAFVAAFFGALMAGATVTSLSPDSTARELEAMLGVTKPSAAILVRGVKERNYAEELGGTLPGTLLWIEGPDTPGWAQTEDRSVIVPRDPDAPAFVAFTSGSTGNPKAAVHRASTLVHTGLFYLDLCLEGQAMTTVATFPLYHLGGMTLILFPSILGGGKVVMMDGYRVPALVEAVERHRIDHIAAIPAMMELLFLRAHVEAHDFSSLRWVMLSGAPVTTQLCRAVHDRLGATVLIGYGQTECPGSNVMTRLGTPAEEIGPFVGWPVEGYEIAIKDDDGNVVSDGEVGEVCVRSHYQMLEYLGNPEATAAAVDADGWLHMGDLGSIREDGGLEIRGRKKEMYIRGGFNVYPVEVEAALLEHPAVSLVAVHALPDDVLGERGYAWVVPEEGQTVSPDELRAFASSTLAYYKLPDVIRVVDELPMNAVGKVDKRVLQAHATDELAAGGAA